MKTRGTQQFTFCISCKKVVVCDPKELSVMSVYLNNFTNKITELGLPISILYCIPLSSQYIDKRQDEGQLFCESYFVNTLLGLQLPLYLEKSKGRKTGEMEK